jgi:hypothetical protein
MPKSFVHQEIAGGYFDGYVLRIVLFCHKRLDISFGKSCLKTK